MLIPNYDRIKIPTRQSTTVIDSDLNNLTLLEVFELYNLILVNHCDYDIEKVSKAVEEFFSQFKNVNFLSHEEKTTFYTLAEKIYLTCSQVGLSADTSSLITASFLEIVDNAFSHNFFETLKNKYSQINNEAEAIELAIQANTSSRPQDYQGQNTGGNGLFYLQKNIFNGLPGELYIRSRGTLLEVLDQKQTKLINSELPYSYGANVFFSLSYE